MSLIARKCKFCERVFKVLETSTQEWCSKDCLHYTAKIPYQKVYHFGKPEKCADKLGRHMKRREKWMKVYEAKMQSYEYSMFYQR